MEQRVVLLHGFTNEEAVSVLKALKSALPAARDAAFATTTDTNMDWKVGELMDHIAEEHRLYRAMKTGTPED
ncbi:MAG TPA: DUF3783 domain-containing protein [Rectinemataceae bacterium]|nr:DUF3783 domain-containing protein [Rectinemataceae bacterium]